MQYSFHLPSWQFFLNYCQRFFFENIILFSNLSNSNFASFRFIFVHKILLKNLKVVFYWISNLHHTHFWFYDLNYISRYKAILKSKCFEFRITLSQAISWYNFEKIHKKFFKRSSDSEIMWVNELSHKKYLMLSHVILLWEPRLKAESQVWDNFWQLKAL